MKIQISISAQTLPKVAAVLRRLFPKLKFELTSEKSGDFLPDPDGDFWFAESPEAKPKNFESIKKALKAFDSKVKIKTIDHTAKRSSRASILLATFSDCDVEVTISLFDGISVIIDPTLTLSKTWIRGAH